MAKSCAGRGACTCGLATACEPEWLERQDIGQHREPLAGSLTEPDSRRKVQTSALLVFHQGAQLCTWVEKKGIEMVAEAAANEAGSEGEEINVLAALFGDETYIRYCASIRKRQIETLRELDSFTCPSLSAFTHMSRCRDMGTKWRGAGLSDFF